ncbi:TolC family protein [Roseimaritima ulvae]|uniref:Outer membrane efflux protein n=1 Tax=Roseimaritima ulvae TaxID=980254 RepID=A0A5B9R333_9BACT|nr:TolC family protein [Roseimaritima ulvae]QEG40743.1 Outer membrane efflux protein [Roseimaritima ulvae]
MAGLHSRPVVRYLARRWAVAVLCGVGVSVAGCESLDQPKRDVGQQRNQQLYQQTLLNTALPETVLPSIADLGAPGGAAPAERQEREMSLHEALTIAMTQPDVKRVDVDGQVAASPNTFYDIQASEARLQAALTAFDATLDSKLYTNQFKSPPNAFFGPGLTQPENRDEAAVQFGLTKPLLHGGLLSTNYNPDPGYFFLPGGTTDSFNPTYASEWQVSLKQPLLRNAGLEVNIAPIQVSQLEVEQSAWEFKNTLMASIRDVVETYWQLHATDVALREYEQVIPVLEEIVRLQRESLRAELVIAADVAKAQAKLHEYKQEYIRIQSERVTRELRLRNLLQLPPHDGYTLRTVTPPTDQQRRLDTGQAYLVAVDNQPDIVKKRLDVCIRRLELLVKANQRKPDLDFTALYRLNGLGENLGDAWDQMASAEFTDVELGIAFSMPVGMRRGKAEYQEARFRLARDQRLLEQQSFSALHALTEAARQVELAYQEYEQAKLQLKYATEWTKGAKLRYENPEPESSSSNWMVENLNDYYFAIRSRTDATIAVAEALNQYNFQMVRFEEVQGTLLEFFAIDYVSDPCRQASRLAPLAVPATALPESPTAGERLIDRLQSATIDQPATLEQPVASGQPAVIGPPVNAQPAMADASFQEFIETLNQY